MTTPKTVLTNAGRAKITNAITLGSPLNIKKMALGSSSIVPLASMTAVPNQVWIGNLESLTVDSTDESMMVARVTVPAGAGPFFVRSAGLFDNAGTLIAIASLATMEQVPGGTSLKISLIISVGADSVSGVIQVPAGPYISSSEKGQPGGVATLDSTGKVPASQLPAIAGGGINQADWPLESGDEGILLPEVLAPALLTVTVEGPGQYGGNYYSNLGGLNEGGETMSKFGILMPDGVTVEPLPEDSVGRAELLSRISNFVDADDVNALIDAAPINAATLAALDNKLDVSAYQDRWKGKHSSVSALRTAWPEGEEGWYAIVNPGGLAPPREWLWDTDENDWVAGSDSSPADSDSVIEGSTHLFFTADRVRSSLLTGLSLLSSLTITAADTVIAALGKLQAQISSKQDELVSGANIKTVNGSSILGAGNLAFGFSSFAEGRSTAAPNATVPVHSLAATGAEADIDAAIVPKGAGGFALSIANNATSGGNKRGQYAVDLCLVRSAATQVASGQYSFNAGYQATASGQYAISISGIASVVGSIALGYQASATVNNYGISIGYRSACYGGITIGRNTAGGSATSVHLGHSIINGDLSSFGVAIGCGITLGGMTGGVVIGHAATGGNASYGVTIGYGAIGSGYGAISIGRGANNSAGSTIIIGDGVSNSFAGVVLLGSGPSHMPGHVGFGNGSSVSLTGVGGNTTNAAPAAIGWGGTGTTVQGQANYVYSFRGKVLAKSAADRALFNVVAVIDTNSNPATITYSSITQDYASAGASAWAMAFANGGGKNFVLNVTGAAATNISWRGQLEFDYIS